MRFKNQTLTNRGRLRQRNSRSVGYQISEWVSASFAPLRFCQSTKSSLMEHTQTSHNTSLMSISNFSESRTLSYLNWSLPRVFCYLLPQPEAGPHFSYLCSLDKIPQTPFWACLIAESFVLTFSSGPCQFGAMTRRGQARGWIIWQFTNGESAPESGW